MSYQTLTLWVPGTPSAQGSMRSPKAGVVIHNSSALKSWRDAIAWAAKDEWRGAPLIDEPVALTCAFVFAKPRRSKHPWHKDTSPDLDKLVRAVGDALQGVVLINDSRICRITAAKYWDAMPFLGGYGPGVRINLETVGW